MKNFLFTSLLFVALVGNSTAQDAWKNHSRTAELEINYRYEECHDVVNGTHKSIVMLQFVNLTNKQLSVSYNKHAWYNDICKGCENTPESRMGIRLAPNETKAGSCADKQTKALYIFDKMLNVKANTLQKFELANIQITTVQ